MVYFEYGCPLVHSKIGNQPRKLFRLSKPTKTLCLDNRLQIIPSLLVLKISSYFLIKSAAS